MSKQKLTRKEKDLLSRQSALERRENEPGFAGNLQISLALIIAVCGFLLYMQTIRYDYALDDQAAITENGFVQKGLSAIGTLFSTGYWDGFRNSGGSLYRPLSLVTFAVEWEFFPNNPAVGHFMNVVLYALTGFILFRLLIRFFKNNIVIPFIAVLLFMAHPVHTEAVANIKGRDEILCMLFSVLSILWLLDYSDGGKKLKLIGSCIAFFLAVLSKENAFTLIAVAPLALYFTREISARNVFISTIPLILTALLYLIIKTSIQRGDLVPQTDTLTNNILSKAPDYMTRMSTAFYVLGKYILLLFFPLRLSIDYSFREIELMKISDWTVLVSIAVVLVLMVYAVIKVKKKDPVAFGILFFFITISIASNLVIVTGTVMADRLLFMPSFGFTIVIAVLLARFLKDKQPDKNDSSVLDFFRAHPKVISVAAALFLLYGFKTVDRNPVWKNNMALMTSAIEDAPNSAYAHYLYGTELVKEASVVKDATQVDSFYNKALAAYLKAVDIHPTYAEFYSEAASTYRKKKNITEAIKYYDLALKYNPRLSQAYNGKGIVYFNAEQYNEAKALFLESLKYSPKDASAMGNVGSCFLALGDNDQAISYFLESLKYNPNSGSVMENLGIAYENKGDKAQANSWYEKAKQVRSSR